MAKDKIKVRAGKLKDGTSMRIFFPQAVIAAPGARTLTITGDEVALVDGEDRWIVKRLKCKDLVVVKLTHTPRPKPKTSSAEG